MGAVKTATQSPITRTVQFSLDIPVPPSVNLTRKIDWAGLRWLRKYYLHADLHLTAYGPKPAPVRILTGAYELHIQIPDGARTDLVNHCKVLIDYLVSREFVAGDDPRNSQLSSALAC